LKGGRVRPRRRYVAFEIVGARMSRNDAVKALDLAFRGAPDLELNRALLKLVFYDASSQRGLLRCGHKQVGEIKAMIIGKEVGKKNVSFEILGISGTIKAAKRKFLTPSQAKS